MQIGKLSEVSRRAFLRRTGQLAMLGATSSYAFGLTGIGEAAAFESQDGYKALVCIYLDGGNDHANTLIPFDAFNYSRYSTLRGGGGSEAGGGAAVPRADLAHTILNQPTEQVLTDNQVYALAPAMGRMKRLFDQGVLAPVLNVGPLEAPITRAQYDSGNSFKYPRPAHLFSHNDQRATWESSRPEGATTGWGGRMADLAQSRNQNTMFTAINTSGSGLFLRGSQAIPYRVSTRGVPVFSGISNGRVYNSVAGSNALEQLLQTSSGNVFEMDYTQVNARSISYGRFINDALSSGNLSTSFGSGSYIADQLRMVAKLIASRQNLGVKRQVFFVSMPGFDSHSNLRAGHGTLLAELDFAVDAFYRATVEMGVSLQVTTFTASDFGRTLAVNGDGSDHGWGGHHFIIGGAVAGGRFYGTAPQVSINGPDQVGRGRLLPSTSVDEYSATLAKWFGVADSELENIQPNIGRFASRDLGFFRKPTSP